MGFSFMRFWRVFLGGALSFSCFPCGKTIVSESQLTISQTPTGTATHGDQMVETSTPRTSKKSGWSTGPHGRIDDEVWHQLADDQRSSECNERGSHQALSLAVLSIAARHAQSHHLAFNFPFVHAFHGWLSASGCLEITFRSGFASTPALFPIFHTNLRKQHEKRFIFTKTKHVLSSPQSHLVH